MAPLLLWLASATVHPFRGRPTPALRVAGLVGLAILALSSCSRATYVFSPGPRPYLNTERPTPSVGVPGAAALTDSLPATTSQRPHQRRASKLHPLVATHAHSAPAAWGRPLATSLVSKRLTKLAATPRRGHSAARYGSGPSGSLVVALCLIGAGLLALLLAAGFSANIVGALFAVFFAVLGAIALVTGLIVLLIALSFNE